LKTRLRARDRTELQCLRRQVIIRRSNARYAASGAGESVRYTEISLRFGSRYALEKRKVDGSNVRGVSPGYGLASRPITALATFQMAEGEGFEPPCPFERQFSRLLPCSVRLSLHSGWTRVDRQRFDPPRVQNRGHFPRKNPKHEIRYPKHQVPRALLSDFGFRIFVRFPRLLADLLIFW
jgi:hypothetical protein